MGVALLATTRSDGRAMTNLANSLRALGHRPGLAVVIVAILAIGIGMTTSVSGYDAPSFVAGIVMLCTVALAAGYFPACRASSIAPVAALRYE